MFRILLVINIALALFQSENGASATCMITRDKYGIEQERRYSSNVGEHILQNAQKLGTAAWGEFEAVPLRHLRLFAEIIQGGGRVPFDGYAHNYDLSRETVDSILTALKGKSDLVTFLSNSKELSVYSEYGDLVLPLFKDTGNPPVESIPGDGNLQTIKDPGVLSSWKNIGPWLKGRRVKLISHGMTAYNERDKIDVGVMVGAVDGNWQGQYYVIETEPGIRKVVRAITYNTGAGFEMQSEGAATPVSERPKFEAANGKKFDISSLPRDARWGFTANEGQPIGVLLEHFSGNSFFEVSSITFAREFGTHGHMRLLIETSTGERFTRDLDELSALKLPANVKASGG